MVRALAVALVLLVSVSLPSSAQVVTGSTGAINGTVSDNTKAVLPGVTVSIASPSMIGGKRETVTDEQGRYQFAAISPGEYTVTFELGGFSTLIREGIRVGLGFTASVNAEMQVATQQETITVAGASPVVDTTSTAVRNNFDASAIANLPTARDFPALIAETPAAKMTRIDVGGSVAMTETGWVVYGMSGGGNNLTIEGIQAANLTNLYNDYGSSEEVQITTAGHTAEMALPGVMANVIAKSGGNTYRGSFYADYEKDDWATHNIDDEQIRLGVVGGPSVDARDTNRIVDYHDVNGSAGGFIVKDKLWWAGSLRHNASRVWHPNYPVTPELTRIVSRSLKMTYNLTQNNKIIGYYSRNFKYQPDRELSTALHPTRDEVEEEDFPIGQYKIEYNSVLTQAMFFEIRYGEYFKEFFHFPRNPSKPLYTDAVTNIRLGGTEGFWSNDYRPQVNGSLSYFKSGFGVNHNFKLGWEIAKYRKPVYHWGKAGRDYDTVDLNSLPLNVEHQLLNGVPNQVVLLETPGASRSDQVTESLYFNDVWQVTPGLSFNLGIRYDRYRGGYPDQVHPASVFNPTEINFPANNDVYHFNTFGPRVGVAWDIKGNGKTVLKFNWGSYPWRPDNPISGQNPNANLWTKTYIWNDLNGDRLYQRGEEGRLVNSVGGVTNQLIDPNWKNNRTKELVTFVERELIPNFGVRTGFVWFTDKYKSVSINPNRPYSAYNVPITVPDPGPDGVVGNSDDGPAFTAYNLDPALLNTPIVNLTTHNPYIDEGDDHYTWEISGVKRMSNGWSLNSSFAKTWSRAAVVNGTNPNMFIATESDRRRHYTDWQSKLAATFQMPFDIKFSPILRNQSGNAYGRTIQVRLNYGTQTIQVEPQSARRVSIVTLADLRFEKGFSVKGKRTAVFLDVFNLFNTNALQDVTQASGPAFLRPIVILAPRVARIGAKFDW